MKIMKKYFILAVTAAMMSACSSSDDVSQSANERLPLKVGTTYDFVEGPKVTTRSTDQSLQGAKVAADATNVKLGLFILKDGNTSKTTTPATLDYEYWNIVSTGLTDNSENSAQYTDVAVTENLVYPSDKDQGINIYAYAPYVASTTYTATNIDGSTSANKITLAVESDQSTNANYLKSDILWGCIGENSKGKTTYPTTLQTTSGVIINGTKYLASKTTAEAGFMKITSTSDAYVTVPMLHRGVKFVVKLGTSGMDISALKEATVKLYTLGLSTTMDLATGTIDKVTSGTSTAVTLTDKLGYTPTDATTSDAELTIADKGDNSGATGVITDNATAPATEKITKYVCSGVVVPMTLSSTGGDKLFEITLKNGSVYAYKTPTTSPIYDFDAGKVYTYDITVKASGLTVTTSVKDWTPIAGETGNAVLQP